MMEKSRYVVLHHVPTIAEPLGLTLAMQSSALHSAQLLRAVLWEASLGI
jgi:hypothetical protein